MIQKDVGTCFKCENFLNIFADSVVIICTNKFDKCICIIREIKGDPSEVEDVDETKFDSKCGKNL